MDVITEGGRTAEFLLHEANGYISREQIFLLPGAVLSASTVLSCVFAGSATATAAGGNTGNGAFGAITVAGDADEGEYTVMVTRAAANGGDLELIDPEGDLVGVGSVGAFFAGGGLSFTLADGSTDFVAGDSFRVAVAESGRKWKQLDLAAADRASRTAAGVLYAAAGSLTAEARAVGIVRHAEVNAHMLLWPDGITAAQQAVACQELEARTILVRV